jgi:hypothetical protein
MNTPNTITIDNVKYIREDSLQTIAPVLEGDFQPFEIGANYLIRTVTMIDTGRVVAASHKYIILEDAAWIADTGRFSDALKKCQFNEVEPFPEGRVVLNATAIIDAVKISSVPKSQK